MPLRPTLTPRLGDPLDTDGFALASVDGRYSGFAFRLKMLYPCEGHTPHPMGSASLAASEQAEEKAAVAVRNSLNAVAQALEEGMAIQKLHLVATFANEPDWQAEFALDAGGAVSGLKLPKPEKDAGEDVIFLLNADICSRVTDMVEALASV